MASCSGCGADIQHAKTQDGQHVPLERYTELSGDGRYTVVELGPPLVVARVAPSSAVAAYPDHRKDCPRYGNGLG